MLKGKRKFIAFWGALIAGLIAFFAYLFKGGEIASLAAFYALVGTILNFFNRSNLKEHENGTPK